MQSSFDFGDGPPAPPPAIAGFFSENRFLSNFWFAKVELDGVIYPSVENAYQAAKTEPRFRDPFVSCKPAEAKRMGREVPLRLEWADPAFRIDLVRQKFAFGTELATLLLATKNLVLIEENKWNDTFWGQCRGRGHNHLGIILMDWRAELALAMKHQAQAHCTEERPVSKRIAFRR